MRCFKSVKFESRSLSDLENFELGRLLEFFLSGERMGRVKGECSRLVRRGREKKGLLFPGVDISLASSPEASATLR